MTFVELIDKHPGLLLACIATICIAAVMIAAVIKGYDL